ncbi:MFS transporter, partial [Peribacillus butanolivorans]|uniref:MFS transporter n=1 Tax=Peribacillus butanolivorans TaxID=421767 RepID=UPI00364896C6
LMPVAATLVTEYAPAGRKNLVYVTMQSGYGLGGLLAAGLGIFVIPQFGWHVMYLFAAAPLILIVPLAFVSLPESVQYMHAKGRRDEANEVVRRMGLSPETADRDEPTSAVGGVRTLFSPQYRARTLTFWSTTFCALLLVYGLNTWLPDIMRSQGYALGSSLSFLIAFNLGSIVGVIIAGGAADRFGPRIIIAATFAIGAAATATLAVDLPTAVLYACCAVGGYGSVGVQTLNNGFIAQSYPAYASATGVGWALGVGRLGAVAGPILAGIVADSSLGTKSNFYMFAIVGVIGAILTLLLRVGYSRTELTRTMSSKSSLSI